MKTEAFCLVMCLMLGSCKTKLLVQTASEESYRYSIYHTYRCGEATDSTYVSGTCIYEYQCFPEIPESVDSFQVTVYNRWGEVYYSSSDRSKTWICDSDSNGTILSAAYYTSMIQRKEGDPSFDTINQMIHVVREIRK